MYNAAKHRAKVRGIPFGIKMEDIVVPDVCPITKEKFVRSWGHAGPQSPSLDRIIPELGYVPGNIAVISSAANVMKQNFTPEQLKQYCLNMIEWIESQSKSCDYADSCENSNISLN